MSALSSRTAAMLAAALLAAPVSSAASEEDEADAELEALHALEERELSGGTQAIERMLHRLGDANPWSRRLRPSLSSGLDGWPDIVDPGELGVALSGTLPFSIESVAGAYDIPVAFNDSVAEYLAFFQGPGRKWYARWLERSHRWVPLFREILRSEGMPEDLVYLSMIESGFSMHARSWASAVGPWQFIEATGRRFGLATDFWVDERRDPVKSTHAAARFLSRLHDAWGDWYLAWAGYNAGPGRVTKAISKYGTTDFWELAATDDAFRKETRHYVPKLIAAALIAKHPERFGFTGLTPETPLEWDVADVPDATDLEVIASCAGVTVDEITTLNPELRQWATPPVPKGAPAYRLRLPKGTAEAFAAGYAKVTPSERFTYRSYRVQKGDTLGKIALMFSTNVQALAKANRSLDPRRLRIGQELVIPIPPAARNASRAAR